MQDSVTDLTNPSNPISPLSPMNLYGQMIAESGCKPTTKLDDLLYAAIIAFCLFMFWKVWNESNHT